MSILLTEEELVQTLKRSSLTTVLVEGPDDVMVYRWIEKEIGTERLDILPCGGRQILINVYRRRHEFNHVRTVFVADKDSFAYQKIPDDLTEIIWTTGYSIENDLYSGRNIENLLDDQEKEDFLLALHSYVKYYAYQLGEFYSGHDYTFRIHPNQILDDKNDLNFEYVLERGYLEPEIQLINYLLENYDLLLRGKSLFALLLRFLSHTKRTVKHSKVALLEHCYRLHRSEAIKRLIREIINRV